MSVNRYTQVSWDKPMSNYVPLPLDNLMKVGATMQKSYDDSVEQAYKLNDLMASVNAIDQHQPYKKVLESKYYPKIEEITNKIVNQGDLSAKRDLNSLARQWMNDPLRQELENSYNQYKIYQQDKIKKGDKYGIWHDPTVSFKGSLDTGDIEGFRYTGMGEIQDHAEEARKQMAGLKADGIDYDNMQLGADGIIRGIKGGRQEIAPQKVQQIALGKIDAFANTLAGQDYVKMIKYQNPNITPDQLRSVVGNYLFSAGSNQIYKNVSSGNSVDVTGLATMKYKQGLDDIEKKRALVGQPIEGITMDLTKGDKDFNELKDLGIYKQNADGSLAVDFSQLKNKPIYDKVNYDKGSYSLKVGETPDKYYINKLGKHIGKIADVIGYKKPLTKENFNEVLSLYNAYSKVRLSDEQMAAPISKIESEKAMRNWNNYDVMDINSPDKPLSEKPKLEKDDELILNNFRNTPDGKMNRDGYIRKANGEIIPIMVRPKALVDDGFHNRISSLGLNSAKYEAGLIKPKGYSEDGFAVIDQENIPNVGIVETLGYNKSDGKGSVFVIRPYDGSQPLSFYTQADMMNYMNQQYYGTQVGNTERYNIAPKKQSFEDTNLLEK